MSCTALSTSPVTKYMHNFVRAVSCACNQGMNQSGAEQLEVRHAFNSDSPEMLGILQDPALIAHSHLCANAYYRSVTAHLCVHIKCLMGFCAYNVSYYICPCRVQVRPVWKHGPQCSLWQSLGLFPGNVVFPFYALFKHK